MNEFLPGGLIDGVALGRLSAAPDKTLCVALALSAILAWAPSRDPLLLLDGTRAAPAPPVWLPWCLLALFAAGSVLFGILYPLEFAAAFGQAPID